jgi:hypothetical protein
MLRLPMNRPRLRRSRSRRVWPLLLVAGLGLLAPACSTPASRGARASAGSTARGSDDAASAGNRGNATFEKLLAAGRYVEVIDSIDARLHETQPPLQRASLEVLRARALLGDNRPRSASLAFQRAERTLPADASDLLRQAIQGQGDAEMALGRWRPAIQQYTRALKLPGLSARQKDELACSAYIAAQQSGDSSVSAWRKRIRVYSEDRVAVLERSLLRQPAVAEAPAVAAAPAAPGNIPADPRTLLAEIHRRGEWGARPIQGNYDPMLPIKRITVHHSAEVMTASGSGVVSAELRTLQASHQNKWADLGYHFLIDPGGGIWEGRELKWQGAHEGVGLNQGAIGICLLGNFEAQPLPGVQSAALGRLLDALCRHFTVDAAHLKTHREVRPDPTDCPGKPLQQWMDAYRRSAASRSLARQ